MEIGTIPTSLIIQQKVGMASLRLGGKNGNCFRFLNKKGADLSVHPLFK
jgi:hypothetical protein